ncbi:MAG: tetratricopeptide repeat protein, partial [Desulfovermiculus sp.]
MTEERAKRKLTAILSADVKGYSRLMGEDELSTVETLKRYREIISSLVQEFNGRVVDSPGDNILAEFSSVVDAVECAVKIQGDLQENNASLPENRRMDFRIGINLGDVIDDEGRIYGDGVNVAARVEGLAEGGGICISRKAFNEVKNKLKLGYENLGEHSVKNIVEPVRVYKVLMEPEYAGRVIDEKRRKSKKWPQTAIAAGLILLILAGAFAIWSFYFRPPSIEPASVDKMAFPLPDKPSIAVLPFVNMSDDPKQDFFCDGITEEIITGLSKVPELFVIARNSVFTYKGEPVKVQKVAEDLGVRYVLEGSVRKSQENLRITAQLVDAVKGHHLWADRWDRELKDVFAVQDEITMKIATAMQVKLTAGELARIVAKGTNNIDAYLKALEANENVARFNRESNARARQLAEEAIELDPQYAFGYTLLGKTHMFDVLLGASRSPKESIAYATELAERAISLDQSIGRARGLLGFLYVMTGQHEKGIIEAEKAVELEPSSDLAHQYLGLALRFGGKPNEAIPVIKKAIRLNPFGSSTYLFNLGLSYLFSGQYEEAIAACEKATTREPNNFGAQLALTVAYGLSGHEKEARAAASEVLRLNPKFSVEYYSKTLLYKRQADKDRFIDALRKAGLPENPPLPLPYKPSIAVLPFVNMSGDPEQEYFSDGISEEIITALSKVQRMFVIARNSTFTYKGKAVQIQRVAKELGVRYVLEGSVRKSGDKVRITAQLVDAATGNHLWAERYDRDLKDIFEVQDEITMRIITALQVKLTEGEQARISGNATDNLEAYLKELQAREHFFRMNKQGSMRARELA